MASIIQAQDPFFLQSSQIKGYINPALTGINGVFTLKAITKNQFYNQSDFSTHAVSAEWSMPCMRLDWGAYYLNDVEGDGRLRTQELGSAIVYSVPLPGFVKDYHHNLRFGLGASYLHKSIDWSRLTFSDQFNKKYGIQQNVSAFVPPDYDSRGYLQLNAGFAYTATYDKSFGFTIGSSFTSIPQVFDDASYDSILGLPQGGSRFNKFSIYVNSDFKILRLFKKPIYLLPSFIMQRQSGLSNYQIGTTLKSRHRINFGSFISISDFDRIENDLKVWTFEVGLGLRRTEREEINIVLQYGYNIGELSNSFGDSYQVTISYLLNRNVCGPIPISKTGCYKFIDGEILYEDAFFIPIEGIDK